MRNPDGTLNGVRVHRLKNKYGTKGLPTAELELSGMNAVMVRSITPLFIVQVYQFNLNVAWKPWPWCSWYSIYIKYYPYLCLYRRCL